MFQAEMYYVVIEIMKCDLFDSNNDSSVGKESACNAEDPSLIPGSGRSAGEGIGYQLQYSWASLVTQMVKNLPAIPETWVRSLGHFVHFVCIVSAVCIMMLCITSCKQMGKQWNQ